MEVTKRTITIGPSTELEQYTWIKTTISVEVQGGTYKEALKVAQLEYWKTVRTDLKIAEELKDAYSKGKDIESAFKKIDKLAQDKINLYSN